MTYDGCPNMNRRKSNEIDIVEYLTYCYETIMFGRVTRTQDAAAMGVRAFVYVIHIL